MLCNFKRISSNCTQISTNTYICKQISVFLETQFFSIISVLKGRIVSAQFSVFLRSSIKKSHFTSIFQLFAPQLEILAGHDHSICWQRHLDLSPVTAFSVFNYRSWENLLGFDPDSQRGILLLFQ